MKITFNPFTSDLYLIFPIQESPMFWSKNTVNIVDQRKD